MNSKLWAKENLLFFGMFVCVVWGGLMTPSVGHARGWLTRKACRYPVASYQTECFVKEPTVSLFNGQDLTGWTDAKGNPASQNWVVQDETIYLKEKGGDLYYERPFENFILEFEFKINHKGNSGIKYKSWNKSGFGLGCEYQMYDDITFKDNKPFYRTAGLYNVYEPMTDVNLLNMEGFNTGKIVVMGDYIEHWLNGKRSVSATVGSADWQARVAQSKFSKNPEFGTTKVGRILLQDHDCEAWFKNIKITELKKWDGNLCP